VQQLLASVLEPIYDSSQVLAQLPLFEMFRQQCANFATSASLVSGCKQGVASLCTLRVLWVGMQQRSGSAVNCLGVAAHIQCLLCSERVMCDVACLGAAAHIQCLLYMVKRSVPSQACDEPCTSGSKLGVLDSLQTQLGLLLRAGSKFQGASY
jgi:hypothetical protein